MNMPVFDEEKTLKEKGIKIKLGALEETLVLPLWARARDADTDDPVLNDTSAKDIVAKIDYDFTGIATSYFKNHELVWIIRAYQFEKAVREFLKNNNNAMVINLGAGLDTTFKRVDNSILLWVNVELPDVASLRQKLIPDREREKTIAKSLFDFSWMDDIAPHIESRPMLFMAAGVLCYFEADEVAMLFKKLSSTYPAAHVLFDAMSWFTVWFSNRAILKKSRMAATARLKWHLKRASRLKRWVDTIKIVEEYPMFSGVPIKETWSNRLKRDIKIAGRLRLYNMVHIRLS